MGDHTVRVSRGKYTFIKRSLSIVILRHGEPWHEQQDAFNALASIMAELDAARAVIAAARTLYKNGDASQDLIDALAAHTALVDDSEPPSEWVSMPC